MKILVTGAKGQLGKNFIEVITRESKKISKQNTSYEIISTDIDTLDITKLEDVLTFFDKNMPNIVYHFAAYTNPNKAENEEKELCTLVNDIGTKNIVEACKSYDSTLIYTSTDYVFDGEKQGEYTVTDKPNPINVYGKTKLAGEKYVQELKKYFILRISWVFGVYGNNFLYTMKNITENKDELSIVGDQIGSPTFTEDLSVYLYKLINCTDYGIYNVTNEGFCSWAEFAKYFFKKIGRNVKINEISSAEYSSKIKRPLNSRLSKEGNLMRLPSWQDAVDRFVENME